MPSELAPTIAAIVPVLNGRSYLERSLPALVRAGAGRITEILVIDDGSTDGSAELAADLGARVILSGGVGRGPALARNLGAQAVEADIIVFVDSDVVVHEDVIERVREAFSDNSLTALYGSYDDAPPHRGFSSQYVNLRHHHGHQLPSESASTFWSGLGAVRREAFLRTGGFDPADYPRPSIEDIELGRRLREGGGRIRRDPSIQGTHLKEWGFIEAIRTDVLYRAIPWSRLMRRYPGDFGDLNVGQGERARAFLALVFFLTAALGVSGFLPWWAPVSAFLVCLLGNLRLAGLYGRVNGWVFMLLAMLFHQVYYLYSGAAYAWCVLTPDRRGDGN